MRIIEKKMRAIIKLITRASMVITKRNSDAG